MNLIKIGSRIVNLDVMTNANLAYCGSDDRRGVRVYFGAESETFYGAEAASIRSWIIDIAIDIAAVQAETVRKQAYFAAASARTCPTCGGEGDCPDCGMSATH